MTILKSKTLQQAHDEAVDITLKRLAQTVEKTQNLLAVLKDMLFDF